MLKTRLGLFIILIAPLCVASNEWIPTYPDGQMRFQGELIAESCTVEVGDTQLIVPMGQVSTNRFKAAGDDADPVPFALHLKNCNTKVSERVSITFHGIADDKDPDVLSVGDGAGAASGVGVAIFDGQGKFIPVNSETWTWISMYQRASTLQFVARYRATGNTVLEGVASAQAWFSLTYL